MIKYGEKSIRRHSEIKNNKKRNTIHDLLLKLPAAQKNVDLRVDFHPAPDNLCCPPEYLRKIIAETKAESTDLIEKESAEELTAKTEKFAEEWAPVADKLWKENKHPNPKTQYFRDTVEAKSGK